MAAVVKYIIPYHFADETKRNLGISTQVAVLATSIEIFQFSE
jgi:hypothetical protein